MGEPAAAGTRQHNYERRMARQRSGGRLEKQRRLAAGPVDWPYLASKSTSAAHNNRIDSIGTRINATWSQRALRPIPGSLALIDARHSWPTHTCMAFNE